MTNDDVTLKPNIPFPDTAVMASPPRRRSTLWLVAGGMFMAVLDATIVNVTLPAMRTGLGATVTDLAWIVDAYTLTMAALILAGGLLADRWGAKRLYLTGLAIFVIASALCGAAPSIGVLVAARLLQGTGAALFLPASLTIVRTTFADPDERASAIAQWAFVASLAAAVGPVLGGLLVDGLGWRSVFFINVPTGIVAFVLTAWIVAGRLASDARPFDWGGQIASTIMLGGLSFAAIEIPVQGIQSLASWVAMFGAFIAMLALLSIERRVREPMVPLGWFRNTAFVAANLIGFLVYVGYFGMLFILSLYLHGAYGLNGRATGFALLPVAASLSAGNMFAARLQGHLSPRLLITGSLAISGFSAPAVAMFLTGHAPWPAVIVALSVFGTGTAASVPPVISTVLAQVSETGAGVASGLLNAVRQLGSLLGVAAASATSALSAELPTALWIVAMIATASYIIAALSALLGISLRDVRA